ncbi:PPC domain-containing DNA-binding protein [Chthoniobacter flavus]|uniref:PPC domain-containing DNA-binding protein n=1 Tax=Chthoniobacter flavus TaxID=191863 RepID=UPI0009FCEBD8|nr:PPC domain-containing DNA-binding protein [Chthoniobacter flavus]
MRARLLQTDPERTFALVFDEGDEVVSNLLTFAEEQKIQSSHFSGIGAFANVTLGYFDLERRDYKHLPIADQVEVLSLIGNVAFAGTERKIHAHVVLGKRDGTAHGGHLLEAHVRPTLELVLIESPAHLQRETDPKTGLPLLKL